VKFVITLVLGTRGRRLESCLLHQIHTIQGVMRMKILVACEESQIVTKAFRAKGHYAISCDLQFCSGGHPEWHVTADVRDYLTAYKWDMLIAFPPCTHIAVSGARYFKEKQADGRQQQAVDFFMLLANAPIEKIAIENPVGIMSTKWRKPDQIIQPWQFGHPESKKTCLWLKNLPFLQPTNIIELPECGYWENQTPSGQNKLGPSEHRAKIRSKTYEGIAEAMANAWG
jgi:site-specific DNA-cytosine methylase